MSSARRVRFVLLAAAAAIIALSSAKTFGQAAAQATNDAPNTYQSIEGWAKLPEGRTWGSTSAVEVDKDGKSIWVAERCGANSCLDAPAVDIVLKFDPAGTLVTHFGAGLMIFPHGIFVDRDGNVWVTDGQDNAPRAQGGGRAAGGNTPAPTGPPAGATKGHQIFKFSPDG